MELDDVTGRGKRIIIRDKATGQRFVVGSIEDEVSVSDGEQKYFIQIVRLEADISADGDPTRYVFRIGYYTRRADGRFCLGSQYAPITTPVEFVSLLRAL